MTRGQPLKNSLGPPRGSSLPELIVVLAVLGIIATMTVVSARTLQDRLAADGAAASSARAIADARHHAIRRGVRTALHLDSAPARLRIVAGTDTVAVHELGALFGVTLTTSRDSIAWSPTGLGFGAANARVIVARHAAAETVFVSRLGRVRR